MMQVPGAQHQRNQAMNKPSTSKPAGNGPTGVTSMNVAEAVDRSDSRTGKKGLQSAKPRGGTNSQNVIGA